MIFNQQGRTEAIDFLDGLCHTAKAADGVGFQHVIFCTNVTYAEAGYKRGTCYVITPLPPLHIYLWLFFMRLTYDTSPDFVNHQNDPKDVEKLTVQNAFAEKWRTLDPSANVMAIHSIEEALNTARGLVKTLKEGETVQALVTGSLHLVGGALSILEQADAL